MRAEELIARAAARGCDLQALAPPRRPHRRAEERRRAERNLWRPPQEDGLPPLVADGKGTRVYRRPEWSLAEIGQAARGVPRLAFVAACFSFAGDRSGYWELWSALHRFAVSVATRERWAPQVRGIDGGGRFYLAELCQLVLDAEQYPALFSAVPDLPSIVIGVEPRVWERVLSKRYAAIEYRWLEWLGTAAGIMQPRLSNDALQ